MTIFKLFISNATALTCSTIVGLVLSTPALSAPVFSIGEAQFIDKVLAQDKLLEEAQIGLEIKRVELDASRDNYQNWKPAVTAELGYRYQDLDRVTTSPHPYEKNHTQTPRKIGIVVTKRFLGNPSNLALGVSRSRSKKWFERSGGSTPTGGAVLNQEYATDSYIRYTYPLLKHDSNAVSRKSYRRNIIDLARQKLLFHEIKEDFLANRLNDYLLWVLFYQQAQIDRVFLHAFEKLQPKDAADVALLNSAVKKIQVDSAITQSQLQGIREKLSVLLDDAAILSATPRFDLRQRSTFIAKELRDYLTYHNRTLQRIALNMVLEKIDTAHYQNQKLPTLNLRLQARYGTEDIIGGTSGTTRTDDRQTNYGASLTFSYPLGGSISNRAELTKSQLGMRKLEISYQEKRQDLVADIRLLENLLRQDETQFLAAIDAATHSSEIEYQGYQARQTSFRDLLQSYHDERDAHMEHIENLVDYQLKRIEYDNLLDRMIVAEEG